MHITAAKLAFPTITSLNKGSFLDPSITKPAVSTNIHIETDAEISRTSHDKEI